MRIEQPVSAELDQLWRACSTAEGLQTWHADEVEGTVEVGSRLRLGWPELGASLYVSVTEVSPQRRVVMWGGGRRTAIEVSPGQIALVHSGFTSPDEAEGTTSAWRLSLATLAHQLREHPWASRQVRWAIVPARLTAAQAHVYFTDSGALGAWLTSSGEVGPVGSVARLRLRWGAELTGQVLARTDGRDLALGWQEQGRSVLALRTFPHPTSEADRILGLQWSVWQRQPDHEQTTRQLTASLRRLAHVVGQSVQA